MNLPREQQRAQLVEELVQEVVRRIVPKLRRPVSTYRLQLNGSFRFEDAARVVPYLASLGVTDLYASPFLKAAPGSTHGYDVVDHNQLNGELGGDEGYRRMVEAVQARGMGQVLDFVPNHMAIGSENPIWMDVLENGPSSIYAHFFDIDWNPIKEELENRVLVPILGDQYGAVLERGEIKLLFENGGFTIAYWDHRFPVAPRQYTQLLQYRLPELEKALGGDNLHLQDFLSILTSLEKMPPRSETDPARIAERHREKEVVKRRLMALCEASPEIRGFIEENVRQYNGTPGEPHSFDLLDHLLREQAYRLAYWRVAAEEINYRRFFDINGLAAIRMEDPRVMRHTHALVFDLVAKGELQGLRIDHPDGLHSPTEYFHALQQEFLVQSCRKLFLERNARRPPDVLEAEWAELEPLIRERQQKDAEAGRESPLYRPLFVVVEKILALEEKPPLHWAVHGTTGYDFMTLLNGLFVDRENQRAMSDAFLRFTGERLDFEELVYQKKRLIMSDSMASEINVLARQLNRISELDRRTRDFTLNSLKRALIEVIACFPVYRTYVSAGGGAPDERDRQWVEKAVGRAKRKNPTLNVSIFHFIRDVLLCKTDAYVTEEARQARLAFVLKLQQVTSPVTAKGVEDTAFYAYNRLVSLNEVGGEPAAFGIALERFHRENQERAEQWPGSLLSTTTHDTKRSEDVRARINVLSEIPDEWRRRAQLWSRFNRRHKRELQERHAPDRNEEYLFYQTLIGAWPNEPMNAAAREEFVARMQAYMLKAIKEAKVNTSWTNPDEEWEAAVTGFVGDVLDVRKADRFLRDFTAFQRRFSRPGAFNALSQVVLKLTCPGVSDVYQGNELWDYSLVDPDNRRPVDFEKRAALLKAIDEEAAEDRRALCNELIASWRDGRIKLFVTAELLRLRRRLPGLFAAGRYEPLQVHGEQARRVVAFARRLDEQCTITLAPRLVTPLLEKSETLSGRNAWLDTFVETPFDEPGSDWIDLFTGMVHHTVDAEGRTGLWLHKVFSGFPVVVLVPKALHATLGDGTAAAQRPGEERSGAPA